MHIVIIGNGISGITAARNIRKHSGHEITVISCETRHFFSRTALMYIYMGHMTYEHTKPYEDWFWEKNRIQLLFDRVERVDPQSKQLFCSQSSPIKYDKLIIASGSHSRKAGCKGEELQGVQGLYSYPDLQNMEHNSKGLKKAVVVGGGLIGIEMAEMFHTRGIEVCMLVREKGYWRNVLPAGEAAIVDREARHFGIDIRYGTQLQEIEGDSSGKVKGIITDTGERIECGFVGITIGVAPNIHFLEGSGILTDRGVLVNRQLQTNVPDVYAIGDCAQFTDPLPNRRPVEQVWYTGRMQGETVADSICLNKDVAYQPGPWFNSAKFFHIEYQTYGTVPANLGEGQAEVYWEHPKGRKCIHFVYESDSLRFKGVNLLGVRLRHEVCDRWLREGADMLRVLKELPKAHFDPEFFHTYEREVIELFNRQHPAHAIPMATKKSFLSRLFSNRRQRE